MKMIPCLAFFFVYIVPSGLEMAGECNPAAEATGYTSLPLRGISCRVPAIWNPSLTQPHVKLIPMRFRNLNHLEYLLSAQV